MARLKRELKEVKQGVEKKVAEARRETEEALLAQVEDRFQEYRASMEAETALQRRAAGRAQARLEALQRAMQQESEPDETHQSESNTRTHQVTEKLLSALLQLQDSADPMDPNALYENVHTAVQYSIQGVFSDHQLEMQSLQDLHDAALLEAKRGSRSASNTTITTPASFATLLHRTPSAGSDTLRDLQNELHAAREETEQERQRVAMVCIHMKTSLQDKNARFEQAVMEKADALVNDYKATTEQAISAEMEVRNAMEALSSQISCERSSIGVQTIAEPAPQSYLARAVSEEFRGRNSLPFDHKSDEAERASHNATKLFERDVMRKAQSLLQKYSAAVSLDGGNITGPSNGIPPPHSRVSRSVSPRTLPSISMPEYGEEDEEEEGAGATLVTAHRRGVERGYMGQKMAQCP